MSIASFTASTDSCLIRGTAVTLQVRGEGEGETVGHTGDVVDDLLYRLSPVDQMVEDGAHDRSCAGVVRLCLSAEVHTVEHEAPEREHGLADLRGLPDLAGFGGGLDDVVDEGVDTPRAHWA